LKFSHVYSLENTLFCGLLLDLERDGSVEILAGDAAGNIQVLDALTGTSNDKYSGPRAEQQSWLPGMPLETFKFLML
jgi:hypothetical protein